MSFMPDVDKIYILATLLCGPDISKYYVHKKSQLRLVKRFDMGTSFSLTGTLREFRYVQVTRVLAFTRNLRVHGNGKRKYLRLSVIIECFTWSVI